MATIGIGSAPRFLPGVRLHHDKARGRWVILAPERVIELDEIAHAIVKLCDGQRTVDMIVRELAKEFDAMPEEVGDDVRALIDELIAKRVFRL